MTIDNHDNGSCTFLYLPKSVCTMSPCFGACLVVELGGDVEALGLGQFVARAELPVLVFVGPELKFQPGYFFPRGLHVSDSLHHVLVLFTCQLGNVKTKSFTLSSLSIVMTVIKDSELGEVDFVPLY